MRVGQGRGRSASQPSTSPAGARLTSGQQESQPTPSSARKMAPTQGHVCTTPTTLRRSCLYRSRCARGRKGPGRERMGFHNSSSQLSSPMQRSGRAAGPVLSRDKQGKAMTSGCHSFTRAFHRQRPHTHPRAPLCQSPSTPGCYLGWGTGLESSPCL